MTDKIEEIIAGAIAYSQPGSSGLVVAKRLCERLRARGLGVLPLEATNEMILAVLEPGETETDLQPADCWDHMRRAFDPHKWEQGEDLPRIGARLICGTCERPFDPEQIDQTVCQVCMESGLGAGPAE